MTVPALDPAPFWIGGAFIGLAWATVVAHWESLDPAALYWSAVLGAAGGLWGSHLLGIPVYGTHGPLIWLRVWEGGKSWQGGLFGGAATAMLVLRVSRRPVLRYTDVLAAALPLGYAIGRIGCFFHGDDYGSPAGVPWAVQYGPGTEAHWAQVQTHLIDSSAPLTIPVHPTQLYHSILGVALFVVLSSVPKLPAGRRVALLALGYGIGRFALEWVRGDFRPFLGGLSLQQCICIVLMTIGVALLLRQARSAPAAAVPVDAP